MGTPTGRLDPVRTLGVEVEAAMQESSRLVLQAELDAQKTQDQRNKLGQFATPTLLAGQILRHATALLAKSQRIKFLDPGFGTGAFYSALLQTSPPSRIAKAAGFEIDRHYGEPAQRLWRKGPLTLRLEDFTKATPPTKETDKVNLLICNPPYVRHHHLEGADKLRLQEICLRHSGIPLNGLSGLYCYYLLICHAWMAKGGVAAWLIPSEFMDVNYGRQVKRYLLEKVSLLHVHRFDPNEVQFNDALVSSAVVVFKNTRPSKDHRVRFSYGGSLESPSMANDVPADHLIDEAKWSRFPTQQGRSVATENKLSDLFTIKRGIATGANSFFILTEQRVGELGLPRQWLKPILPSPRYLDSDEIEADTQGMPKIERRLFLLSCDLDIDDIRTAYPALADYLKRGEVDGIPDGYICKHRSPWYSQENRPPAPFLCSYLGRSASARATPFRFILNHSQATAANVYLLLYPKPHLQRVLEADRAACRKVWKALSSIGAAMLLSEGRVYGGGLHKLEPKELANVSAEPILELFSELARPVQKRLGF